MFNAHIKCTEPNVHMLYKLADRPHHIRIFLLSVACLNDEILKNDATDDMNNF